MTSVLRNLLAMSCPGDKKLKVWLQEWKALYYTLMRMMPTYNGRELLLVQLRKSEALLTHDVAHFDRLDTHHPDKTTEWMISRAAYLLYQLDQANNQADIDRKYARMNEAAKQPPKVKSGDAHQVGKGKGGNGKGNGLGRGGGAKAKQPAAKSKPPCFGWQKGHCRFGDQCSFDHSGPKGTDTSKGAGRGASAKANPAKAQPAPPPAKAAQSADAAKGKGKKGKRARSKSATPAAAGANAPTKPKTEISGKLCKCVSAGNVCPSGRQCEFSHDASLYKQWQKYNQAMAAHRGRSGSPSPKAS